MAVDSLGQLTVDLVANTGGFEKGMDRAQRALKSATKEATYQAGQLDKLVGQIDPVAAAYGKLDKMEEQLRKHRAAGRLDQVDFADYLKKINEQRDAIAQTDKSFAKLGVSANQTAAAFRQLPAQLTDVFTSLAGGQNPLLVLIQQGGQIKDSFGGIGETFDALGGKIKSFFTGGAGAAELGGSLAGAAAQSQKLAENAGDAGEGLGDIAEGSNTAAESAGNAKKAIDALNTSTASAGVTFGALATAAVGLTAVGVLAYMFYDAEKQASAFNKALYAGSNEAGVSAGQLQAIAKQAGEVTKNYGDAKTAALELVKASDVSLEQLQNLTSASAAISKFSGDGADEIAKFFGSLGDSATTAAEKISEKYGLLTSDQYLVIRALEDNGDTQKALDVLSADLNNDALKRLEEYRNSLSTVEQGWDDIKRAISDAYGAVRSEVFPDLAKEIQIIQRILDTRAAGGVSGFVSNGLSQLNSALGLGTGENDDSTEALQARLAELKARQKGTEDLNAAQGESAKANRELIAVQKELNKQLDDVSPLTKRENAEKKLNEQFKKLYENSGKTGQKSPLLDGVDFDGKKFSGGAYDKLLAGINDKNKDKTVKAYQEDAATKMLDNLRQQYSALQAQDGVAQKLNQSQQALAKWEQEIADIKTKKVLTADQKSLLAHEQALTNQYKTNAALETALELKAKAAKEDQKLLAFQENLSSQLASAKTGLSNNLAGIGLGDQQRQRLQEQLSIQQSYQSQLDRLESQHNKGQISDSLYIKETQALQSALDQRLAMQTNFYEAEDEARSDWTLGASSAFQNYLDQAKDVAGQAKSAFTSLYDGLTDAAVDWAFGADQSFGDVAKSFAKMIAKMALQSAASSVFSSIAGSALGAAFGSGSGTAASAGSTAAGYTAQYGFDDGGYTGPGGKYEPAGIVHGGEVVIRKEVVDQPGMKDYLVNLNKRGRGYADGGYVGLSGGASPAPAAAGQIVINQSFQVDSAGGGTSQQDSQALGQAYADVARRGAQQEIAKETQPGGQIWRLVNGR